jgi:glutathionylspermidine synthase
VKEIDELDDATAELHKMCLKAVEYVVKNKLWKPLAIPEQYGQYIESVWFRQDPTIVGRFDLVYDGKSPPKMLEYNADTPTSLLEMAVAQWFWLKDVLPGSDQFNSAHEKLIDAWRKVGSILPAGSIVHFARIEDEPEDWVTSEYMRDTCSQAGLKTKSLKIADIGWNGSRFTDLDEVPVQVLHKLYPWEWMMREEFGRFVLSDTTAFLEPAWKAILSSKAILSLMWEMFPGHPNLLPAYFDVDQRLGERYVRKPILGREGRNVQLVGPGLGQATDGTYGAEGYIFQAYQPLPVFDGNHVVIGSWIVDGQPAGIGVREDSGPILNNHSRFVPHYF